MSKIGFLDSGIGGLTVLEEFCQSNNSKTAVNELSEIIYLADLKNLPYGEKTLERLTAILEENLKWFAQQNALMVVLACNTSSALLNEKIKQNFKQLYIFDLITALAEQIDREHKNLDKIAVFSTLATHQSGAYISNLQKVLPQAQIISIACPAFVPLIENHLTESDFSLEQINKLALGCLQEYTQNLPFEPSAIVFGCTHYPLLKMAFAQRFKNSLFLDPAQALAQQLQKYKFSDQTKFLSFSTAQAETFEAKLKALAKILNCVQYFSNQAQIAKTA